MKFLRNKKTFLIFSVFLSFLLLTSFFYKEKYDAKQNLHENQNEQLQPIEKSVSSVEIKLVMIEEEENQEQVQEEWIQTEVENYQVLRYIEPMLKTDDVKGVQQILKKFSFYNGSIDGIYGPQTKEAVQKFQKYYGLTPTGVVDLDDYNLLAQIYEEEEMPVAGYVKPKGKVSLLVILDERILYVLEDNKVFYKFPIGVGKIDTPSPIGNWKIISKDKWSGGFGTRWLGINVPYGKFGIHGTNKPWSIGRAESHGCFRMYNRDIEILYNWLTWGTKVYIVGGNFPYNIPWRNIDDGDRGSDVWEVQNRLKELGYYKWRPDGVFGWGTQNAVKKFQKDNKLPVDGKVSWTTLHKMGLYLFQ